MAVKHEAILGRSDVYRVDPDQIEIVEGWNPRKSFGDELDIELKNSVVENNVLVPIRVRKVDDKFKLIDGERRLRAVRLAKEEGHEIESVPCVIERKNINDAEALVVSLLTNEGKRLAPSEEAEAYSRLLKWGLSAEKVAQKVGKSAATVYNRLKLVDGSEQVKSAVDNKEVTIQEAQQIISASEGNIEKQGEALQEAKGAEKPKKTKKAKKSVDVQEVQDLLNENINEFYSTEDPHQKQFCAGIVRALSIVLEQEDPLENNESNKIAA